jgi:DNA-binding response OmpR family regulator
MSCPRARNGARRVLVAEDHVLLAGRIAEGLRHADLAVDVANDGSAALTQAGLTAYDVIVLGRDLPVVHGDQAARTASGHNLSARISLSGPPDRRGRGAVGQVLAAWR